MSFILIGVGLNNGTRETVRMRIKHFLFNRGRLLGYSGLVENEEDGRCDSRNNSVLNGKMPFPGVGTLCVLVSTRCVAGVNNSEEKEQNIINKAHKINTKK